MAIEVAQSGAQSRGAERLARRPAAIDIRPPWGQNFMFLKIPSGIARTMAMAAHHLAL